MSLEKLVIIPRTASELVQLQGLPTKVWRVAKTGYGTSRLVGGEARWKVGDGQW